MLKTKVGKTNNVNITSSRIFWKVRGLYGEVIGLTALEQLSDTLWLKQVQFALRKRGVVNFYLFFSKSGRPCNSFPISASQVNMFHNH